MAYLCALPELCCCTCAQDDDFGCRRRFFSPLDHGDCGNSRGHELLQFVVVEKKETHSQLKNHSRREWASESRSALVIIVIPVDVVFCLRATAMVALYCCSCWARAHEQNRRMVSLSLRRKLLFVCPSAGSQADLRLCVLDGHWLVVFVCRLSGKATQLECRSAALESIVGSVGIPSAKKNDETPN